MSSNGSGARKPRAGAARPAPAAESEPPRDERVVSPAPASDDVEADRSLRPRTLAEFIGQPQVREHLQIVLEAARQRAEACPHLLFLGPPGLGKTTLAHIVSNEMGAQIRVTSGPALERPGDLVAILSNLEEGDTLFVDEIHRLPRAVEEVLYPAMEDRAVDMVLGKGPSARTMHYRLEPFTLIGATTRTGMITGPLRDRFGFAPRLDYYAPEDLSLIVRRSAGLLGVPIDADGGWEIATRSRGTPRIANRLLGLVRDFAQVRARGEITREVAAEALKVFEIDPLGLDRIDLAILRLLCERYGGRPVGVETIAIAIGEEAQTIEDVYEPYLVQSGFLQRTPRGRVATGAAWSHLGLEPPSDDGSRLF